MKKLFLLLAMLAVLCSGVAGDISPLEGVPVLGMPKAEAFETKPVNFVVIDRARSVGKADMRGWTTPRPMPRWMKCSPKTRSRTRKP